MNSLKKYLPDLLTGTTSRRTLWSCIKVSQITENKQFNKKIIKQANPERRIVPPRAGFKKI